MKRLTTRIVKRDRTIRERQRLALFVERAAVPERPFSGPGPRYLVRPSVTAACAPSLRAIAAALRDETHPIDDAGLKAVGRWLTDGGGPFFGQDSKAALREVDRLQHVIVGAATAVSDGEPVAVADYQGTRADSPAGAHTWPWPARRRTRPPQPAE